MNLFSISIKFHLETINESILSSEYSLRISSSIFTEVLVSPFIVFANANARWARQRSAGSEVWFFSRMSKINFITSNILLSPWKLKASAKSKYTSSQVSYKSVMLMTAVFLPLVKYFSITGIISVSTRFTTWP